MNYENNLIIRLERNINFIQSVQINKEKILIEQIKLNPEKKEISVIMCNLVEWNFDSEIITNSKIESLLVMFNQIEKITSELPQGLIRLDCRNNMLKK